MLSSMHLWSPRRFLPFFFIDPPPTEISTLSLHDALPISAELLLVLADRAQHVREKLRPALAAGEVVISDRYSDSTVRSEEHTSELQSHVNLVCRLLLEKKKKERHT